MKPKSGLCRRALDYITLFAFIVALGSANAGATCSVCALKLEHRTGSYTITLASEKSVYAAGSPIDVRISISNPGMHPISIDGKSLVSQFAIHVVAPNYKATQPDRIPSAYVDRTIAPGGTYTFPLTSLQKWSFTFNRPGIYYVNVSYGKVDSNILSFSIVKSG